LIYSEQLSHHDFLAVDPKQALQPNQCCDLVCVPEQSSLVVQEVGSPIAVSKQNPVVTDIVTLTRKKHVHKKDALPKKACLKNKKDALPNVAVANPLIVKLKIARNTNKKANVHECIIDKEKVKPFETVFARMEKRRILLQKKTFNSSNKK